MLLFAGCSSSITRSAATMPDAGLAALIDSLFVEFAKPGAPGAAVIVARAGRVLERRAFGLASIAARVPVMLHTSFPVASLTKPITATAALLLVQDGRLRLDETIRDVFPEFPAYGSRVTVRHLLSHTSGLIESLEPALRPGESVLSRLMATDSLQSAPGSRFSYNNVGYALLTQIVARRSGEGFGRFVHRRILEPLGMRDSYLCGETPARNTSLLGYVPSGGSWEPIADACDPRWIGPGGVYASAEDLLRFDNALDDGRLLNAQLRLEAWTPFALANGSKAPYGLGWLLSPYRGASRVRHWGHIRAFHSILARFPDHRLTIIVLSNRDQDTTLSGLQSVEPLAMRIADRLLFPPDSTR